MKITATAIKLSKKNALKIAEKKGGFIGKIVVRDDVTKFDLLYFPNYIIDFKYYVKSSIFRKRKNETLKSSKIKIICDCTTSVVALADTLPNMEEIYVKKEIVKEKLILDKELTNRAQKLAFKLLRKYIVGHQNIEVFNIKEIYRPYWVAIYGEVIEGNKVRYLPIEADGFKNSRVF